MVLWEAQCLGLGSGRHQPPCIRPRTIPLSISKNYCPAVGKIWSRSYDCYRQLEYALNESVLGTVSAILLPFSLVADNFGSR